MNPPQANTSARHTPMSNYEWLMRKGWNGKLEDFMNSYGAKLTDFDDLNRALDLIACLKEEYEEEMDAAGEPRPVSPRPRPLNPEMAEFVPGAAGYVRGIDQTPEQEYNQLVTDYYEEQWQYDRGLVPDNRPVWRRRERTLLRDSPQFPRNFRTPSPPQFDLPEVEYYDREEGVMYSPQTTPQPSPPSPLPQNSEGYRPARETNNHYSFNRNIRGGVGVPQVSRHHHHHHHHQEHSQGEPRGLGISMAATPHDLCLGEQRNRVRRSSRPEYNISTGAAPFEQNSHVSSREIDTSENSDSTAVASESETSRNARVEEGNDSED